VQSRIRGCFPVSKNSLEQPPSSKTKSLAPNFFETLRQHTIAGFLIDPDSNRRGNHDSVGWRVIACERKPRSNRHSATMTRTIPVGSQVDGIPKTNAAGPGQI
jgi:hypothetical protein